MLTLYTIAKGFEGEFDQIQRNAIASWRWAFQGAQILLFGGREPGVAEYASGHGLRSFWVERNDGGVPVVADAIEQAEILASLETRCLINADIILGAGFADAVQAVERRFPDAFLFTTRRYGVHVEGPLDLGDGWEDKLAPKAPYRRTGIDVFCYRGDWLADMPPFAVGRSSWDNWIVGRAKRLKVPIVNGERFVSIYHQDHKKPKREAEIGENRRLLRLAPEDGGGLVNAGFTINAKGQIRGRLSL